MTRITVTLSKQRHRALKEAAARTGKTLGQIVEESLEFYGIKTMTAAGDLVEQARRNSDLPPREAERLAVRETRARRTEEAL